MTQQLVISPIHEDPKRADKLCEIVFDLDSFTDKNYLTHNFHPYPAKFVPQIPRQIISTISSKGESVLDPFCGSGTSLVEASLLGRRAVGFDINPLACLISEVKTTPLAQEEVRQAYSFLSAVEDVLFQIELRGASVVESYKPPQFLNRNHWFQPQVQHELAALKTLIWQLPSRRLQNFFKVAFSAIVVKVSNQDSDTRWVAVKKEVPLGDVVRAFLAKAQDMLKRIEQYGAQRPTRAEVFVHSAIEPFPLEDESIDAVITSPPYLNSYDYYLYHKLRFFWLGFDHYSVQERELGSRNRHCDRGEGLGTYTTGMRVALREIFRVLRRNKILCVVIGDAILRGQLIDMRKTYTLICEQLGFVLRHAFSYDQRRYTSSFTRNLKTTFKHSHILFFERRK